jgi:hypothetical protein
MNIHRSRSHAVASSLRDDSGNTSQRAIRRPKRLLLLTSAIVICSLLLGLGLLRWFSASRSTSLANTVAIDIVYIHPAAGEVFLIWGINGWLAVPEELRLSGTTVTDKGAMQTPLSLEAGVFTGRLLVPTWSSFQYGFMITATRDGREVAVWDGRDEFELRLGQTGRGIEVISAIDLKPEQPSSGVEAEE